MLDYVFRDAPVMDEKAKQKFLVPEKAPLLSDLAKVFSEVPGEDAKAFEEAFLAFTKERGLEMKDVAQPVRVALTGRTASPGLFDVAALLGRAKTFERLVAASKLAAP